MAAGTEQQRWAVLRTAGLTELAVRLGLSSQGKVGRELGWLLSNLASGGHWDQGEALLSAGAHEALAHQLLVQTEADSLRGLLQAVSVLRGPLDGPHRNYRRDPLDCRGRRLRHSGVGPALASFGARPVPRSLRRLAGRLSARLQPSKDVPKSNLPTRIFFPY